VRRIIKLLVGVPLVAFVALFVAGLLLPNSAFYSRRRPTRLGRAVNWVSGVLYQIPFLPHFLASLETTGRKTGRPHTIPIVVADYDGEQYLVSMLGEKSGWVPNIRAAGGKAVLKHGRRREVDLVEVPVGERAPILKAYIQRAIGARPHFEQSPDDPVEAFESVAEHYPVFRIVAA
jgi:deazaflavin-dependent oxidoreductase (nitroreductase family)